jgi:hypothetical protein
MTAVHTRKLSKWSLWARKRKARKLCIRCGKKARKFTLCDRCHDADLARQRLKSRNWMTRAIEDGVLGVRATGPEPFFETECDKLSEAAPIVSEVCERLHELEDIRLGLGISILSRLVQVSEVSHMAFRYTVRLMHGDASIFNSFQQQSQDRAISKQAAHAEFHSVLTAIERAFPELSHQIKHIRGQVSRVEEQRSHNTNSQGLVVSVERHEQ